MSHRVIAGFAKGRKLKLVPGDTTRPIMDRVKEALFSILGQNILDCQFLDLFGGTGSVGIEALSRGAEYVLFIELDRRAAQIIRENLEHTQLNEQAEVRVMNAFDLLKRKPDTEYDYIFIAPPQYKGLWKESLLALEANPGWIADHTTVIVQIDPREWEDLPLTTLHEVDRRKYGKTMLLFYERADSAEESESSPGS
jgi:16S rRNA (guanine(966)-N(2))-methyltransferase RsmD